MSTGKSEECKECDDKIKSKEDAYDCKNCGSTVHHAYCTVWCPNCNKEYCHSCADKVMYWEDEKYLVCCDEVDD